MSLLMSAKTVSSRLASLFHRNGTDPSNNSGLSARLSSPPAPPIGRTIRAAEGGVPNAGPQRPVEAGSIQKARRRRYSREEKLRILRLADACHERGQLGALLRREGIYFSTLRDFQQQRANGRLEAGYERDRQATRAEAAQDKKRITELEVQNRTLKRRLQQAELIIDVQKKLSELLGVTLPQIEPSTQEGNPTLS
jgi:transposase